MTSTKPGKLYLIPCGISDADVKLILPPIVPDTVKNISFFLAENARTARRFISSLQLGITIEELQFDDLNKNTKIEQLEALMKPLKLGNDMGVLSESGCPGIADPGSLAADWAHKNDIEVVPLVGPSSILLALMGSGFNGQKFCFHGYLPIDEKDRRKQIKVLEEESAKANQTQLFIETPYRNNKMLDSILDTCRNDTLLCLARDLTGSENLLKTLSVGDWKKQKPDLNKLPTVFVLYSGLFN